MIKNVHQFLKNDFKVLVKKELHRETIVGKFEMQ